ncbi:MAG: family 78 glycoside hydrolase catalytic domain [Eubacteriales bacterium]|nr:family 78 glycoside hydrolase catalytic domain [Eubacteriales bacterium]
MTEKMVETKFEPKWYTIPELAETAPVNPYHKEQEPGREMCSEIKNLHVLARGEINIDTRNGKEFKAILRITADDYYKVWINGIFAGQGPAPAYPEAYYYNEIDITHLVRPGKNLVAVHAYYQGLVNRVWNSGDGRFALAADAVIIENHRETVVCPVWKYQKSEAYSGETTGYDTQFLENFDSRLWDENWNKLQEDMSKENTEKMPEKDTPKENMEKTPEEDTLKENTEEAPKADTPEEGKKTAASQKHWEYMAEAKWADYALRLQPTKMLDIYEINPLILEKRSENTWFIDVGQEIAGSLVLKARGKSGRKIVIQCGEELQEDGSVRYEMRCNCKYEEIWTLDDGICKLEPYDYKGFRYCFLRMEEGVELLEAKVRIRHYPFDDALCTLQTDDRTLNRIFDLCKNTIKYGIQEAYLDCPTREKGQYLGDAVISARAQVWLSGSVEMLRKCIDQFARTAMVCPGLMAVAPGSLMQEIADFSLLWGELLLTDYQFTHDKAYLAKYYPTAKAVIMYFHKYERENGLLYCVDEKWNLVDWPENLRDDYDFVLSRPVVASGYHNVINALYIGAVKTLAQIEEILEYPHAFDWEKLRGAYVKMFYRPEKKLFADSGHSSHTAVHSNIYPLYFGFVPEEATENVVRFLRKKGLCCGVMLSYFLLKGLGRAGYYKEMYELLVNDSEHGWVNMLRDGATTCLEAWGKDQKWNTSFCHPWGTAPISLIIEDLCGIQLDEREEKGYREEPHLPSGMKECKLHIGWLKK